MKKAYSTHETHLISFVFRDCGTKAGSALLASADCTKFRDIIETEGLVYFTGTMG